MTMNLKTTTHGDKFDRVLSLLEKCDIKHDRILYKRGNSTNPIFTINNVTLTSDNSILCYFAQQFSSNLYSNDVLTQARINNWLDINSKLEQCKDIWMNPIKDPKTYPFSRKDYGMTKNKTMKDLLNQVEKSLVNNDTTYLISNTLSVADIAIFSTLFDMFVEVFDPRYRKSFPIIEKYVQNIYQVLTNENCDVSKFCTKEPLLKEEQQPNNSKEVKKLKQEVLNLQKELEQVKGENKGENKEEKQSKNPLMLLPPSPMIFDQVKKDYFEADKNNTLSDYWSNLWKNFDNDGYSIYIAKYKYDSDYDGKSLRFISNALDGVKQSCDKDKANNWSFSSICAVYAGQGKQEEDDIYNKYNIFSCWIFRGQSVIKEVGDYAEYNDWVKLDPTSEQDQVQIQTYFKDKYIGDYSVVKRIILR